MKTGLGIHAGSCAERGRSASPASAETVAAFVDAMAATRSPATVRRRVAGIAVAHEAVGCGKTLASPVVRLALKRMHRRKGRRQGQAQGLTWPLRQRLLDAASDRLIDDCNRALLAVAYDAMLRRAELPALQVSDLLEGMQGDATLLVRPSKTDGEGWGEMLYLARDTVRLVHTWLERSGITHGRLFRSVHKCGALGERLDPSQVPASSRRWPAGPGCPRRWSRGCRGTARRLALRRT